MHSEEQHPWRLFFIRIILPSVFAICLFIITIFKIIIPAFEDSLLEGKQEMIRELVNSAGSILATFEQKEAAGELSGVEAREQALFYLEHLRHGEQLKDYFWVTDMEPRMVMHPYRPDLNGKELSDFRDIEGKQMFMEFIKIAREKGAGYVRYLWEAPDDSGRKVPKLSYVTAFTPWGWVVGTGIYIEDVQEEMDALVNRIFKISLGITAVISFLLIIITRESIRIESERQDKERGLRESREKYKILVEASTEGVIMALESRFMYSNRTIQKMLGYSKEEFVKIDYKDFFWDAESEYSGYGNFMAMLEGRDALLQYEARLKTFDDKLLNAVMTSSKIDIAGKKGFITIVKDISSHKKMEGELGESREKYEQLINNISVGVFRTQMDEGRFIEANPAALTIFGKKDKEELFNTRVRDLFQDQGAGREFIRGLLKNEYVRHQILEVRQSGREPVIVSISAVLVRDDKGSPLYCDGFVEDITESKKAEYERENLIVELQASLLFLNQPIQVDRGKFPACGGDVTIRAASKIMSREQASAILVTGEDDDDYIGILTDQDIRHRVVSKERELSIQVADVMTSPLISVTEQSLMFEALLMMLEESVTHLVVRDSSGHIVGMVNDLEVLKALQYPLATLLRDIHTAKNPEEIIEIRRRLPRLACTLVASGADTRNLSRLLSAVSEAIMKKMIGFAITELGTPPVNFVFMALGSVGRQEQTLVTDQDNAIVYADVEPEREVEVNAYFLDLGTRVCDWLDKAGYVYCDGEIMAKNPKWCKPLSVWKKYFRTWVNTMQPEALLDTTIFFDFRGVHGDLTLTGELQEELNALMGTKPLFFFFLAQNCLRFKPPIGFFKKIVVESAGEFRQKFSIKKAMTPIVDIARIYALMNQVDEQGTLSRLNKLKDMGVLNNDYYQELVLAYKYLMGVRFEHQATALANGRKPDNHIHPKRVTSFERAVLKEALIQVSNFQSKLGMEFKAG